jgi:hypothetical protein
VAGILIGMVSGFIKILVVSDGSADMKRELRVDNMVDSIGKGGETVEKNDFMTLERKAGVVDWNNLQDTIVNRVTFSKGCIYFGIVRINVIINERSNGED